MLADEIVVKVVQSYSVFVVLDFLAESIGQSGISPHRHPHGQVDLLFLSMFVE